MPDPYWEKVGERVYARRRLIEAVWAKRLRREQMARERMVKLTQKWNRSRRKRKRTRGK